MSERICKIEMSADICFGLQWSITHFPEIHEKNDDENFIFLIEI